MIAQGKLDNYSVLIMPGGRPDLYMQNLGYNGINEIRDYVGRGGGYIGICGGAYIAAENNVWRGWAGEPRSYASYPMIGIFDGTADGPVADFAPSYQDFHCKVKIADNNHPVSAGLPDTVEYLYDHGPMFLFQNAANKAVLGTSVRGNKNFIICSEYYNGRVFLTSGHPEVDDSKITWAMMINAFKWCSRINN
jgi:glutamine amidotransferase-like uncharacterized protein